MGGKWNGGCGELSGGHGTRLEAWTQLLGHHPAFHLPISSSASACPLYTLQTAIRRARAIPGSRGLARTLWCVPPPPVSAKANLIWDLQFVDPNYRGLGGPGEPTVTFSCHPWRQPSATCFPPTVALRSDPTWAIRATANGTTATALSSNSPLRHSVHSPLSTPRNHQHRVLHP